MANDNWMTPVWLLNHVRTFFGGSIDVDLFSSSEANLVVWADRYGTPLSPILSLDGASTVWANPPYSRGNVDKCVDHFLGLMDDAPDTEGLILVNAATSTRWQQRLFCEASRVLIFKKRISFLDANLEPSRGNRYDSLMFYFGKRTGAFGEAFADLGVVAR